MKKANNVHLKNTVYVYLTLKLPIGKYTIYKHFKMSYHWRWVENSFFFNHLATNFFLRLFKTTALYLKNFLSFIQASSDVWILKKTTEQHNVMALETLVSQVKCFIWGSAKCQNRETVMGNIIRPCHKVFAERWENSPFTLNFRIPHF